jgi:DNA replication and repair protein RecF
MVGFEEELGKVSGEVVFDKETVLLEVIVNRGMVMGKKVNKRKYIVDGASKKKEGLVGFLPAVLFRPEDVEIVSGSPDGRRKLFDRLLSQVDAVYRSSLFTYEHALRSRNRILDSIREGSMTRYALTFWDGLLIKHGGIIQDKRRELVLFMNDLFGRSEMFNKLSLNVDSSAVSEARLEQYKEAEIAAGYTLVGPHKDDYQIMEAKRDLATYGSRGEKRMAMLAIKMGEIYFLEKQGGTKVLLLLDDIFSELDEVHKQEVLRVTKSRQVVLTTADENDVKMFGEVNKINLL